MVSLLRRSAALAAASLFLLLPVAASDAKDKPRLDKTIRYLQDVQHKDGGFGEGKSNPTFSTWAALAVASAGVNPRDQKKPGGVDVYTYLTRNTAGANQSTDFARAILVSSAAGADPTKFGPLNPLRRLLANQETDGSFPQRPGGDAAVNATAFGVLAMKSIPAGTPTGDTTRADLSARSARALDWLQANQKDDGSWGDGADPNGSVDLTGSVIEALNAAGRRNTPAQKKALAYIRSRQNADGGFGQGEPGEESNAASTSWVARALTAAGASPASVQASGSKKSPLDYLAAMQQSDGSVRYSATQDSNRVWMTTYTTPAFAGRSLPVAAVAREEKKQQPAAKAPTQTRGPVDPVPGAGGTANGGDGDVTAGGGGAGADLFSKPQPGSQGNAPGGPRDTQTPKSSPLPGSSPQPSGDSVIGKLIGENSTLAAGPNRRLGTAPGLRAAAAGGTAPPGLVAALAAALALCAIGGVYLERRRKA